MVDERALPAPDFEHAQPVPVVAADDIEHVGLGPPVPLDERGVVLPLSAARVRIPECPAGLLLVL